MKPYICSVLVSQVTPESLQLDLSEGDYQLEISDARVTLFVPDSTLSEWRAIGNRILALCNEAELAAMHAEAAIGSEEEPDDGPVTPLVVTQDDVNEAFDRR